MFGKGASRGGWPWFLRRGPLRCRAQQQGALQLSLRHKWERRRLTLSHSRGPKEGVSLVSHNFNQIGHILDHVDDEEVAASIRSPSLPPATIRFSLSSSPILRTAMRKHGMRDVAKGLDVSQVFFVFHVFVFQSLYTHNTKNSSRQQLKNELTHM